MKRGDVNVLLIYVGILLALIVFWAVLLWGGWVVIG